VPKDETIDVVLLPPLRRPLDATRRFPSHRELSVVEPTRLAMEELVRSTSVGSWKQLAVDCGYPSSQTSRIHSGRLVDVAPVVLPHLVCDDRLIDKLPHDASVVDRNHNSSWDSLP
jgi:hypothetical protein